MNCNKVFETIGICGGGKMGTSFLNFIVPFDYNIVFYIRNESKLQEVKRRYEKNISAKRSNSSGASVVFTNRIEDLGHCDVVFEFVSEDIKTKSLLFQELTGQAENSRQIVVTGSSTLVPSKLCQRNAITACIGVHFIYPVQYVKTAEVIYSSKTSREVIEKIRDFLVYTGKKPFVVNEEVGSFSIRILISVQNEAFKLSKEFGLNPAQIDKIIARDNVVLPPFELCDSVGPEIIYNSIKGLYEGCKEYEEYSDFSNYLVQMMSNGCLEGNNGKSCIGRFENGKGKQIIEPDERQENHIRNRIKLAYINSCLDILDFGLLDTVQLDTAMSEINQSASGPISLLFEQDLCETLSILEEFSIKYGDRYKPSGILKYMASFKVGRDEIDRQIRLFKMGGGRPYWHNQDIVSTKKLPAKT
ncbi:MAG TPA: 3-hydroxyacyl-CoA dehydrogenase NAD-binding domain-containing protein [Clostridia bacterium]|nr:3-hydroxyacyl-CoA dehydrogenase NAD-binding domain-containing protein [Clostridia bacterium]